VVEAHAAVEEVLFRERGGYSLFGDLEDGLDAGRAIVGDVTEDGNTEAGGEAVGASAREMKRKAVLLSWSFL
jgi:hypothetical protein